ncbi:hypothetical protein UC8_20940 [Roseimaritima ulvae]|uniref:Uncharacterized protein n=2 Tax=Roseimaritima ulvae TaxID=980254 RepID=A0A5B9QR10_9BACT|nr:hypothetical protein UC8_20940 [Roseimaritima ulvae]
MLPLSYLLCSILCVAILATLGAERKLRSLILLPLTLLVTLAAWLYGDAAAGALPGGGGPFPWAWFPLAAAWLAALAGASGSRVVPLAVLLLAGLAAWGFADSAALTSPDSPAPSTAPVVPASPATAVALAAHRTLAVALAAVALAALTRLGSGFPQGAQLQNWRFLSQLSGGMLLGLILSLAYLYFVQDRPLGLAPRIAWTVLLAETIAAFCVYRGVHAVTQPDTSVKANAPAQSNADIKSNAPVKPNAGGAAGDGDWDGSADRPGRSIGAARATALLVLFALAGGGLSLIPIILNGATRLGE